MKRRNEDTPTERLTCRQCGTAWVIPSTDCLIVDMPGGERRIWFPCHQCHVPHISMCPIHVGMHALRHGAHHHNWRHLAHDDALHLEIVLWHTLVNDLEPALRRELSAILGREVS